MEASSRNVKAMQLLSSFVRQDSEDLIDIDSPSGSSDKRESDQQISRPRNRQAFYERAHTYSPLRWFAKPLWLSPLECARWGWENVDVDVLCCVSCKAHMSGRTPPTQNPKSYDECSRRLTESLRSGHRLACPWSSSPSPEHFLRLPYDTRPKAQQVFKQHVTHLLQLQEQLPLLPESQLCDMGLSPSQVEEVLRPCSSLPQDVSAHVARSAAVLALTGWTTSTCSGAAQVHCSLCYRHVGMWNFLTLANPCLGDLPADVSDSEEEVAMNGDEEVRESEGNVSVCNGERSGENGDKEVNGDDKTDNKTESQNGETKDDNVESVLTESQIDKIVNTDGTKSDSQSTLKDEADLGLQQPDSAITENKDLLGSSATTMETSEDQKDLRQSGNTAMETDDKSEESLEKGEQDESNSVKTEKQETPAVMETPGEESKNVENIKSTTTAMETDNKSEEMLEKEMQEESKSVKGDVKDQQETCPVIETGDKKQPGPDSCTKDLIERESDLGVTESVDKIDPDSDLPAKDEKVEKKEDSVADDASDVTANHSEPRDPESTKSPEKDQKLNQDDSESQTETKSPKLSPNREEENTDSLGAEKEDNSMHDSPCDHSIDKENSDNILSIPTNDNDSDKHKLDERDPAVEQDEPPTKRQKTITQPEPVRRKPRRQRSLFQPLIEHHPWCPWVATSPGGGAESRAMHAGSESSGGADKTGWRQVLYLLMPQYSPNKSQSIRARASTASPEVLRSIRRLFNEWTSPGVAR